MQDVLAHKGSTKKKKFRAPKSTGIWFSLVCSSKSENVVSFAQTTQGTIASSSAPKFSGKALIYVTLLGKEGNVKLADTLFLIMWISFRYNLFLFLISFIFKLLFRNVDGLCFPLCTHKGTHAHALVLQACSCEKQYSVFLLVLFLFIVELTAEG